MIKTALLGLGGIGRFYLQALRKNARFQIQALVDQDARKHPTHLSLDHFFTEFKEDSLDLVIIALPNHLHFEAASQALKKGFHLIVEKPLTLSIIEAEELYSLSLEQQRLLFTFFHRRFNRVIHSFQPRSSVVYAHARYLENIKEHSLDEAWYQDPQKVGGGCLMDNGSNVLDLFSLFFSSLEPLDIHLSDPTFEQNAYILLDHPRGKATIELDWQYEGEKKDMSIYLEDGKRIEFDFLNIDPCDARTKEFKGSLWHEYEIGLEYFADLFFAPEKDFTTVNRQGVSNLTLLSRLYLFGRSPRSALSASR
jgi:predicted dehydrogenase